MSTPVATTMTAPQRRLQLFAAYLGLAALSNWMAFLLRFDEVIPASQWELFASMLSLLLAIRALAFYPFRLYDSLWRYTSLWDIRDLALSIGLSSLVFAGVVRLGLGMRAYPSSVFVIDALLLLSLQARLRALPRLLRERVWMGAARKTSGCSAMDSSAPSSPLSTPGRCRAPTPSPSPWTTVAAPAPGPPK